MDKEQFAIDLINELIDMKREMQDMSGEITEAAKTIKQSNDKMLLGLSAIAAHLHERNVLYKHVHDIKME